MKNYDVLNELVPKTQELHRAIFDKGYEEGQKDILEQLRYDNGISRQAVLKILKNNRYRFNISQEENCEGKVLWSEKLIKDDACKEIEQLPFIMPTKKIGKWTDSKDSIERHYDFINSTKRCSLCGGTGNILDKFCHNCGAKMEVNE